MQMKKKEGEREAQRVEQNMLDLFNEKERAAGRSVAQRCSVACSLIAMPSISGEGGS